MSEQRPVSSVSDFTRCQRLKYSLHQCDSVPLKAAAGLDWSFQTLKSQNNTIETNSIYADEYSNFEFSKNYFNVISQEIK